MKRLLSVVLVLAIGLPLLVWAAFTIWLHRQPDDFRAQIEQFTTLEFLDIVGDFAFAPEHPDRALYGRRVYPGRGTSPWVRRSSLDGRPRMLSVALGPDLWLAYSTETASIHQFWRGHIHYAGPVYDAQHGSEPESRGDAYLRPPTETAWRVFEDGEWQPAKIRYRGHGMATESGALFLRYDVALASGAPREVTEWPERETHAVSPAAGLERRFEFGPGPALALFFSAGTPRPAIATGARAEGDLLVFDEETRRARLVHRFARPALPIESRDLSENATDPFAAHDCHSCHNVRERVVGPAFSEIALRYASAHRETTLRQLSRRIREGSVGRWGSTAMTPHEDLGEREARAMAAAILETPPSEAPAIAVETRGAEATWTFDADTEEPPQTLHPTLTTTPIDPAHFTPQVGGLAFLPDGRLAVATWDRDGAVFALRGWAEPPAELEIVRIAEGLHEPLGLAVVDDALYVMQKQEITRLVDVDGDDWVDEYRSIANDWRVTSNFHEFGFGLVEHEGMLYGSLGVCVLKGGKSCRDQTPDRGRVFRADPTTGRVEFIAGGLRTPNGLALSPSGDLFVTDNQGDWLPASKLIRVREGDHHGWRAPGDERDPRAAARPALWLPHNEIGNSPTEPLFLTKGPYAGHVIFGDVFNGGLKRAVLEEVEGVLQGAAFHFSGGFEGPVNRLLETPSGGFVVGEIGSRGNWGERGKDGYGLEVVEMGDEPAFEILGLSLRSDGFDLEFTRPISDEIVLVPGDFEAKDWFYLPSEIYGGPKYDLRTLAVDTVDTSPDRRRVRITIGGLESDRVVYLRLDPRIRSNEGDPLWVREAWYTLNALPRGTESEAGARPGDRRAGAEGDENDLPNTLSPEEIASGWRLLFDGESFSGWKIYGAPGDEIEHWVIEDDALHFTRDVSFLGLVWNHANPFAQGAMDLMTKEVFGDFELSIDWRISPGGNSGIFYGVPDESRPLAWDLGLEMQVLDDTGHRDGEIERHRAGDLYDLQSLARNAARPVGDWNTARIRVDGRRVRHWLNGTLMADLVRGSAEWEAALAASKFAGTEGFGLASRGHLTLQDHGDPVWFRNIKIKPLDGTD